MMSRGPCLRSSLTYRMTGRSSSRYGELTTLSGYVSDYATLPDGTYTTGGINIDVGSALTR